MSEPTLIPLGMNAKLYFGSAGEIATSEIDNAIDVTLSLEADSADVTTRGNKGWKAEVATLKTCGVEWEMLWKPSDPAFQAIRNAFLTSSQVSLLVLDRADGEGPDADFSITNFSRPEPLAEGIKVSVSAKVAAWREWHEAA